MQQVPSGHMQGGGLKRGKVCVWRMENRLPAAVKMCKSEMNTAKWSCWHAPLGRAGSDLPGIQEAGAGGGMLLQELQEGGERRDCSHDASTLLGALLRHPASIWCSFSGVHHKL